jgi:acyl-CoA thioester hydrolase
MFKEQFKVRFYETDALAHVSNTVLVGWFESGREPIFKIFNPSLDLRRWPLILASYKVDFVQQIFYGQDVQVHSYISRIGGSSFDVYQELWQDQQKCATGTTTMVSFDYEHNKAKPINDAIRLSLSEHMLGQG